MSHFKNSRSLHALIALLLILGSWNCSDNASSSNGDSSAETPTAEAPIDPAARPQLFVQVDKLRMRDAEGPDANVIAELPEGAQLDDLGEVSKGVHEATLRGVKHKAPWMKVRTTSGLVGWVFGGAVSTEAPAETSATGSFAAYLEKLSPNCKALDIARKALQNRLRKSQDLADKDASVDAFHEFYWKTIDKASDFSADPKKARDFELLAYNPDNKPIPAHVKAKAKEWEACGVGLEFPEGMLYLNEHPDYMVTHFADLASPAMKKYLLQMQKEIKAGFSEDGGLMISPRELAVRLAFWDDFLKANSKFVYANDIEGSQKNSVGILMGGLDNTPAFSYTTDKLNEDWKAAYEWLMSTHKGKPSATIVKDYYLLLKASQWKPTEKSWAYVKKHRGW